MWTPPNDQIHEQPVEIKEELPDGAEEGPDPLIYLELGTTPPVTLRPDLFEPVPAPKKSSKKEIKGKRKAIEKVPMDAIVSQIRSGALSMYGAAKKYGVPRTTIQYRLSKDFKNRGTRGPNTIFSKEEEVEIVQQLHDLARQGFPLTKRSLGHKVASFLKAHPRQTPFKDNQPGKTWTVLFMKRHPELNFQKPEAVRVAEWTICENTIRTWFRTVLGYFEEHMLTDILKDSTRVLNGETIGFLLKDYSIVKTISEKPNMTILLSFSADGSFFAPLVAHPGTRLKANARKYYNEDWLLEPSDNGQIDSKSLVSYVKTKLRPELIKRGTRFPVLYFVSDGDAVFEAADLCRKYGVIIISLFPGAGQIFQNANNTVYRRLKQNWTLVASEWRANNVNGKISAKVFGSLFEKAMNSSFDTTLIKNGFSIRGLYRFDANAILYSNKTYKDNPLDETDYAEEPPRMVQVPQESLEIALQMLGSSKINMYLTESVDDLSQEDKVLCYIYKNILNAAEYSSKTDVPTAASSSLNLSPRVKIPSIKTKDEEHSSNTEVDEDGRGEFLEMLVEDKSESELDSNDSATDDATPPKRPKASSGSCQMNEADASSPTGSTKIDPECFAKEHICSYPRVTAHFCKVANKSKYQACFVDVTGMYIAYINKCNETSREPVSSEVYSRLLQEERANDPILPTRCDECQHVEKADGGDAKCDFLNK